MFFYHRRIDMPEILGNDHERHAVHHSERSPGMAQAVKGDGRRDCRARDSFRHRPLLVGMLPGCTRAAGEHRLVTAASGAVLTKECSTLVGQDNVARLAVLAPADGDRAGVRIEIVHLEPRQLAIAAPARTSDRKSGLLAFISRVASAMDR